LKPIIVEKACTGVMAIPNARAASVSTPDSDSQG
jgi:hypothetical protein